MGQARSCSNLWTLLAPMILDSAPIVRNIHFWLYFVVHSYFYSKNSEKELEYGIKSLDHYVMSLNQNFGLWLEEAKSKFYSSPILTNPNSREILKYLYENLEYDSSMIEQQIIIKLTSLRDVVISSLSETIAKNEKLELSNQVQRFFEVNFIRCFPT